MNIIGTGFAIIGIIVGTQPGAGLAGALLSGVSGIILGIIATKADRADR